jgi:hypothetical protein
MKKKVEHEPSAASLRAVPPVDFSRHRAGRKNPYAKRMKREGWELVHEEPSKASLRAIPELTEGAKSQRNPYARRLRAQGIELQVGRHRPLQGKEVGPTVVKSVRLPPAVWARLEKQARTSGMALHALVRAALLEWLDSHAT